MFLFCIYAACATAILFLVVLISRLHYFLIRYIFFLLGKPKQVGLIEMFKNCLIHKDFIKISQSVGHNFWSLLCDDNN